MELVTDFKFTDVDYVWAPRCFIKYTPENYMPMSEYIEQIWYGDDGDCEFSTNGFCVRTSGGLILFDYDYYSVNHIKTKDVIVAETEYGAVLVFQEADGTLTAVDCSKLQQ